MRTAPEFVDNALQQFLGLEDAVLDHLYIHGGLSGLASALTVDAMLSDEDEGVGEDIQGDEQTARRNAVLEFAALEFVPEFGEDAAGGVGTIGHGALSMMKWMDRRTLDHAG